MCVSARPPRDLHQAALAPCTEYSIRAPRLVAYEGGYAMITLSSNLRARALD